MKIVKVTYTTSAEFSDKNKENISKVMLDLNALNHPGIRYTACNANDNKTFIHTAYFNSEEDQKILNEIPSFKIFQEQFKTSGLEVPPKQEILTLIGTSNSIFN